jgi:ribosomal protein L7/L12
MNMELLTPEQVQREAHETVFRQSALQHFVALLVLLSLLVGVLVLSAMGEVPLMFRVLSIGGLALIAILVAGMLGKSLSSRNWLMIVSRKRILVRFRSYLNTALPSDDPQVFSLPLEGIRTARKVREKIVSPAMRRGREKISYLTSLELEIEDDVDLEPLRERLRYERQVKAKTKYHAHPVTVTEEGAIRLKWKDPSTRISPGIDDAVRCLNSLGVRAEESVFEERDLTFTPMESPNNGKPEEPPEALERPADRERLVAKAESSVEADEKIVQLREQGKLIIAIKLARETYGMSLKDAKEYVEGLDRSAAPDQPLSSSDSWEDVDARIVELAEGGRKIEAIRLARETYGMGLKEAKEFVEGLAR